MALVPAVRDALFVNLRRKPVDFRVYFCKGVMDILEYIRDETKGNSIRIHEQIKKNVKFTILES
jgi:hypothetical protein